MSTATFGMRTLCHGAKIACLLAAAALWPYSAACASQEPAAGDAPRENGIEAPEAAPTPSRPTDGKSTGKKENSTASELPSFDLKYLEGPDGKPVYVPDKVRLAEFLRWLDQKNAGHAQTPPGAAVSSMSFDGTADDERALLTARIEIQISTDDAWVRVPLQMSEATLRAAPEHSGAGMAMPAVNPEEGYAWWLKGKGKHELLFSLSVPLRKQSAQRRIQLSLPATVVSLLKLRVPAARVSVKTSERSTLSTKSIGRETEIEVIGLGSRLDLTWQPLPDSAGAEAALEVVTSIVATLVDGENARLEATQLIKSLGPQATFDEVRV